MNSSGVPSDRTAYVVGHLTVPVLNILLSTFRALDSSQTHQVLIMVDDDFSREVRYKIPAFVEVISVPEQRSHIGMLRTLYWALYRLQERGPLDHLHLHGLIPGLAAVQMFRQIEQRPQHVTLNPHGSCMLSKFGIPKSLLLRLLQEGLGAFHVHTTASSSCPKDDDTSADGVMSTVFFDISATKNLQPLVVSGSYQFSKHAIDEFARIAVLLGDERLGIEFGWLGPVNSAAREKFCAAGITPFEETEVHDDNRAQHLARAWLFVDTSRRDVFPIRLAEAMAAGLPSVVLDTRANRNLIEDGVTGYRCKDIVGLIARTAALIDNESLRKTLGAAARERAHTRFSEVAFIGHLWLDAVLFEPRSDLAKTSVNPA